MKIRSANLVAVSALVLSLLAFSVKSHAELNFNTEAFDRVMRDAYLDLQSQYCPTEHCESVYGAKIDSDFAVLNVGLSSESESIRRTAGRYVESILVSLAHDNDPMDPNLDSNVHDMLSLYKQRAPELIQAVERVFPASPTLKYLNRIR